MTNQAAPGNGRNVLIVNGHPDAGKARLGAALAAAYAAGAESAGHRVEILNVAELEFPLVREKDSWEKEPPGPDIASAQLAIVRAEHIVLIYPLWLGDLPALLKGFLEQVLRPGFAFGSLQGNGFPEKKLRGKSARIVVTMGMPAFVYRWFFGAHSLKSLRRNILAFCGMGPIRSTLVGMVESPDPRARLEALRTMEHLGRRAR